MASSKTTSASAKETKRKPRKAAAAPTAPAAPARKAAKPATAKPAAPAPKRSKAAAAVQEPKHVISSEERHRMIAEAAYFRAERRGFQGGNPEHDWLEAVAEVDARLMG